MLNEHISNKQYCRIMRIIDRSSMRKKPIYIGMGSEQRSNNGRLIKPSIPQYDWKRGKTTTTFAMQLYRRARAAHPHHYWT